MICALLSAKLLPKWAVSSAASSRWSTIIVELVLSMTFAQGRSSRLPALLLAGVLAFIALAVIDASGQGTALIHPVLRLEKPKYLLGESIRFWVGVESERSAVIPLGLRKPCSLIITKPDGSTELQTVLWPLDGNPGQGWLGGWGIKAEEVGPYSLELECSGQRTARIPMIVEADAISSEIRATFEFENSGPIKIGARIPVVFSVTNDSAFLIRFPQRGVMMEGVSVSVTRESPPYSADFFYPWQKLTQFPLSPDTYTWNVADKLPSITLEPGKRFDQRLSLEYAYQFEEPGNYRVTFSSVVSVLVGDEQGPFANFCPIRVLAEKSQTFSVLNE
jgi:hypothetical protein